MISLKKIFFFIFFILYTSSAGAQFYLYPMMRQKQEAKENTRWTLADWLVQKQKIRMMDFWLAMNSSSNLFEFFVGGSFGNYKSKMSGITSEELDFHRLDFGGYISIFGAQIEYDEFTDEDLKAASAMGSLRVLGPALQSSHLDLHYGVKRLFNNLTAERFTNQFAGASLSLYLFSFFGIEGNYRHYFEDESTSSRKMDGNRVVAGAFLEAAWMRLIFNWYKETLNISDGIVENETTRSGYEGGIRFFF